MNKKDFLYLTANVFSLPFVFVFSVWLSRLYVGGDQVYYITIYESLPRYGFIEGFGYYNAVVSSLEPVHYFFSWIFSHFLDKDYFVAASNVFLAHSALLWCKKKDVSVPVALLLVTANFYFLVMYFAAERLKFGMIFFLYSLCFFDFYKRSAVLAFFAVISHVQIFVFYAAIMVAFYSEEFHKAFVTRKISPNVFAALFFGGILVLVMYDQLAKKIVAYYSLRDFSELIKILIFFVGSLFYTNNKKAIVVVFFFLIVAVFLFGGKRINMVGFFVFLYCGLGFRGGVNLGVLIVTAYFSVASYDFVADIIDHGNGFHEAQLRRKGEG